MSIVGEMCSFGEWKPVWGQRNPLDDRPSTIYDLFQYAQSNGR